MKAIQGKLRWSLLFRFLPSIEALIRLREFGAAKYNEEAGCENWHGGDPIHYEEAMWRHLVAYSSGEERDEESGESHLACVVFNAFVVMQLRGEYVKNKDGEGVASGSDKGFNRPAWLESDTPTFPDDPRMHMWPPPLPESGEASNK